MESNEEKMRLQEAREKERQERMKEKRRLGRGKCRNA